MPCYFRFYWPHTAGPGHIMRLWKLEQYATQFPHKMYSLQTLKCTMQKCHNPLHCSWMFELWRWSNLFTRCSLFNCLFVMSLSSVDCFIHVWTREMGKCQCYGYVFIGRDRLSIRYLWFPIIYVQSDKQSSQLI